MGAFNNADRPRIKRYTINAKAGKITHYDSGSQQTTEYSGVFGHLKAVLPTAREINGEKKDFLNFVLIDVEDGSESRVEVSRYSKFCLEMLARLNNADVKKPVAFMPYLSQFGGDNGNPKRSVVFARVSEVEGVDASGFPKMKPIEAFYGAEHGNKMPRSQTVMIPDGKGGEKPFMQNGKEVKDDSWLNPMIDGLLVNVMTMLGQVQGQQQGQDDGHGDSPLPEDGGTPVDEVEDEPIVDRPTGG